MESLKEQIENACNEKPAQIKLVKELVKSSEMNRIFSYAQCYFEDMIRTLYEGGPQGGYGDPEDEIYDLGRILGHPKEQIENAILEGYWQSTDELDGEE